MDVNSQLGRRAHPDLHGELDKFKGELRQAGLRESTIHAYLMGSTLFVRWLAGDYTPGPRREERQLTEGPRTRH